MSVPAFSPPGNGSGAASTTPRPIDFASRTIVSPLPIRAGLVKLPGFVCPRCEGPVFSERSKANPLFAGRIVCGDRCNIRPTPAEVAAVRPVPPAPARGRKAVRHG